MNKDTVKTDRDRYCGGSDVPIIMGISPFKTRWQLLLEKAGLAESDFDGNRYTEYGDKMEGKIRDHINKERKKKFFPECLIKGDLRGNADGYNGECILEIKTTSNVHDKVDEYKIYLVQLLFYMELYEVNKGVLSVYNRPEDFSEEFDPERLQIFYIELCDYLDLLGEVNEEIDRFRSDLKMFKENPLMTEEDFLPTAVVEAANKVAVLESRMAEFKVIEAEYKAMKQSLYEAMEKHGIKTWTTFNGTRLTRVDATESILKLVSVFDTEAFAESHPRLFKKFSKEIEKNTNGKAGYVKITLPKG